MSLETQSSVSNLSQRTLATSSVIPLIKNNEPKKKETLLNELKDRVATQLETTTGHGCPNLIRTKYWSVRIMWIILVLIATGASCYLVFRAINSYLKYEVTTQISTVKEIPTQFPTVSICNINPLIKGKEALTNYLVSINKTEFLNQHLFI
jgi:hypothetical protein